MAALVTQVLPHSAASLQAVTGVFNIHPPRSESANSVQVYLSEVSFARVKDCLLYGNIIG